MPNVKSSYLKVIKVPLGFKQEFKPISFKDKMPVLYMELLENKTKVKPELRNKDYVPPLQSTQYTNYQTALNNTSPPKNTYETNLSPPKNTYEKPISPPKNTYETKPQFKNEQKQSPKKEVKILDLKNNKIEIMSKHNKLKNLIDKKTHEVDNKKDEFDFIVDDEPKNDIYDTSDSNTSNAFVKSTYEEPKEEYKEEKSNKEEDEHNKLSTFFDILKGKSILNNSPPQPSQTTQPLQQIPTQTQMQPNHLQNPQQIPSQNPQQVPPYQQSNLPPSLSEITSGKVNYNNNSYREINPNSNDENEYSKKKDLLFKFRLLKKSYKEVNIPDYNEYTDLATLEREYNNIVKNLRIDSNVENYKKYLMVGFFGLEYILSTILKFDEIKGFTQQQILNMNQYERILVEIGEKSYVPEDRQIMPELRLLGIIFMNAATFVGTKMLFKGTGSSILNAVLNPSVPSVPTSTPPPKKKMRGPDIDFDLDKKNE